MIKSQDMRGVLAVILLTVCFYWKITLTSQYVWFDHPDVSYMQLPRLQFMAREIHMGRFPLWDPHIWIGQPLIGQTQPGPLNPLNIAFLMLPLRDGYLRPEFLNWYFVLMHVIAGLGAYALCRDLRRSRTASVFGACLYSFSGFLGSVPWLDVMSGALWTPLICLFFLRAARGIRPMGNAGLSGLFLGIAWLSGHHEIPLLTSAALGTAWLVVLYRRRLAALPPAMMTFAIAGLTGAAQLWPTYEFGRLSLRWGPPGPGPLSWNDTITYLSSEVYSLTPRALSGVLLPDQGTVGDTSGFAGVVGVFLVCLAVFSAWRIRPVRWFAVLGGVSAAYALGAFTPLHGLLYGVIPMLEKARLPVRALHLLGLAMAPLAAYGMDQLLKRRAPGFVKAAARAAFAAGAAALIGIAAGKLPGTGALGVWGLCALALAGALAAWRAGRVQANWLAALLMFTMLTELQAVHTMPWQNVHAENGQRFARTLFEHRDIAEFLRREPAPRRVAVNDQDVPANFGDLHSIDMLEGYTAGVTANLHRHARHTERGYRLYGVTHYVGKAAAHPGQIEAFEGRGGVKVFRVPGALARVRSVHETASVNRVDDLQPVLDAPEFDAGRKVVLIGEAPLLEQCEGDRIELESYAPNRVRIKADMACRGMVVLGDTFYPGWRAFVNGRQTRIWEAYGSVRGVVVEAGSHIVDFRFQPISVYGGLALTAAGILIALLTALVSSLRRTPSGAGRTRVDRS